jgi:hypothetical protein
VTRKDSNLKVPSFSNLTVHERVKKGVTQQITSVIFLGIEELQPTWADSGLVNPRFLRRMTRMVLILWILSAVDQTLSNLASNTVR